MTDLSLLLLEMLNIINMVAIYLASLKVMIHGASFWAMLQSTFFWEDKDLPSQRAQVQVKSRVIVVKVYVESQVFFDYLWLPEAPLQLPLP